MNPTELILIRHGETVWNLENRWQGHLDSPLTPIGLQHSRAVAQRLATMPFDFLYSSDLPRAYRMAEDISTMTGRPIITEPNLRERQLGVFEGLTMAEVRERHPAAYEGYMTRDPKYVIPQGESLEAKHHRVTQAMLAIALRHTGKRIVIITHGGVVDSAFRLAVGLTLAFPRSWTLYNASINSITFQDETWMLGTWGEISHLSRTETPNYY